MSNQTPSKEHSQNARRSPAPSNRSSSPLSILSIRSAKSEEEEAASPRLIPNAHANIVPLTKHADPNRIDVIAYPGINQINTVRTYNQVHCNCGRRIQFRADVALSQPRVDPEIISVSSGTPAIENITISSTEDDPAIVINSTSSSIDMQVSDIEPASDNRDPRVDEWVQKSSH